MATRECTACHATVPAAEFCGDCGARSDAPRAGRLGTWPRFLRPDVYATAHREPVWVPHPGSTLFPRFPGPMRTPLRIGLIAVLMGIIVLAALRINGPLGVVSTLGWPLLFLIYVWQSDVFRDVPVRILVVAMVLGVGSGVGWWFAAGRVLADSYGVTTGSSLALTRVVDTGLLLSAGGGLLMLLPALVCRLIPMPVRESLDGFVIGAFGALWYSTAASTTIVAPQFVEGLIEDYSASRMLQDSMTYGVVTPIVSVAAGGLFGLSLWFRPDRRMGRNPSTARAVVSLCAVVAVGLYAAVWIIDGLALQHAVDLALKLAVSVLALLTTRAGVQTALLHEAPDPATGDPVLCAHCEKVVPDMPFCSACGVATRAESRTSRRLRRENPPVPQPPIAAL